MRIRNLMTFVKVAQLQSFHDTARQMRTTQPAISARITALENELGVKLFVRNTGGTRLSQRGQQLLPYAKQLVAIAQEMKNLVANELPETGTIKIGVADTLAHLWISSLLGHWQEQFPLIDFEITIGISRELQRNLERGELDIALLVAQYGSAETASEALCSYQQCWVAAPDLVENNRRKNILSLKQLAEFSILSFPRDTRPWQYLHDLFQAPKDARPRLHTCSSVESLLTMARQGLGIALLPQPLVEADIQAGSLTELQCEATPPPLDFCCSWLMDDGRILPRLLAESAREVIR